MNGAANCFDAVLDRIHLPPVYPPKHGHNSTTMLMLRSIIAEMFGTCLYVYLGCGAIISSARLGNVDSTAIALSFGFGAYVMVYAIGSMSGGHLNPAITTAFLCSGSISVVEWALYFVSQMIGGIIGAGFLEISNAGSYPPGAGSIAITCNYIVPNDMNDGAAFFTEYILTAMFTFVIYAVVDPSNHTSENSTSGPHAVGMAVAAAHLVGLGITQTSINPARSFGSAVVAGGSQVPGRQFDCWDHHWIFWIAPILGAVTASIMYTYYFDNNVKASGNSVAPHDVEAINPALMGKFAPIIDEAIDSVVNELMNGAQAERRRDRTDDDVDEILRQ